MIYQPSTNILYPTRRYNSVFSSHFAVFPSRVTALVRLNRKRGRVVFREEVLHRPGRLVAVELDSFLPHTLQLIYSGAQKRTAGRSRNQLTVARGVSAKQHLCGEVQQRQVHHVPCYCDSLVLVDDACGVPNLLVQN